MNPTVLFTALAVGLVAIAAWSRVSEALRVASLARASAALGMRFEAQGGRYLNRGLAGVPSVRALGGVVGRNLVTDGRLALLELVTRDGRRRVVAALEVHGVPPFCVEARRPGVSGRASSVEAADDELAPVAPPLFFEHYRVYGHDHGAVHALWSPELAARLLARPGWNLEAHGHHLVAWHDAATHLEPRALREVVDTHRALLAEVTRSSIA